MEVPAKLSHREPVTLRNTSVGARKVTPMPVGYLVANPFQPRLIIDQVELQPLIDSIQRYGFMGHIEARHDPVDQTRPLQIVFGHRRVEAAKQAGLKTVPVAITERSDDQMRQITFVENAARKALTYWEEALFLGTMKRELGLSVRQIAEALSLSRTYVQERLDFLKLQEGPLRTAVERDEIGFSVARFLMQMPEADREDLLARVRHGDLNVTDLRMLRHLQIDRQRQHEPQQGQGTDSTTAAEPTPTAVADSGRLDLRDGQVCAEREIPEEAVKSESDFIRLREDKLNVTALFASPVNSSSVIIRSDLENSVYQFDQAHLLGSEVKNDEMVDEIENRDVSSISAETDERRGVFFDRTIIPRRTGEDYAVQVVSQLEANLFHLQQKMAKADFSALNADMSDRLLRAKIALSEALALLP